MSLEYLFFILCIDDIYSLVIYYVVGYDIVWFEKQIILLENILFALIKLHNKTVFSLHTRN